MLRAVSGAATGGWSEAACAPGNSRAPVGRRLEDGVFWIGLIVGLVVGLVTAGLGVFVCLARAAEGGPWR